MSTERETSPAERRLLRLLKAHGNTRVYVAHAARGRYAVVAETSSGRYRRESAVAAGTLDDLERTGWVQRRHERIRLGSYVGRRHLDGLDGEQLELTEGGRAALARPRVRAGAQA